MKQSGIDNFGAWIRNETWDEVLKAKTVDEKSEMLQNMLLKKLDEFLPQKNKTVTSDDQPFCSEKMKRLKRLKSREYHKNRKSVKWMELNKKYKIEVAKAKIIGI